MSSLSATSALWVEKRKTLLLLLFCREHLLRRSGTEQTHPKRFAQTQGRVPTFQVAPPSSFCSGKQSRRLENLPSRGLPLS